MVLIEVLLIGRIYKNKKLDLAIIALSVIALVGFWFLIREQGAIGNEQFIKSTIPHHSGAILMCEEAAITDSEIEQLCGEIGKSQEQEIRQMKSILQSFGKIAASPHIELPSDIGIFNFEKPFCLMYNHFYENSCGGNGECLARR